MIIITFFVLHAISYTVYSSDSLYRASVVFGRDADVSVTSFGLYDHTGNLLYHAQGLDARTLYVSTTGSVFAVGDTHLCLYTAEGKEMYLEKLNCPNNFGFSPDDSLFFSSDRDGITAYSNQGTVVYALRPGRLFASTEQGELIAIVAVDTVFVYEYGIEKLSTVLATPYARSIVFTDDGMSIIIEEPTGTETIHVPGRIGDEQ